MIYEKLTSGTPGKYRSPYSATGYSEFVQTFTTFLMFYPMTRIMILGRAGLQIYIFYPIWKGFSRYIFYQVHLNKNFRSVKTSWSIFGCDFPTTRRTPMRFLERSFRCLDILLLESYMIFVLFSPQAQFLAKFFSTQKRVNRKMNRFCNKTA